LKRENLVLIGIPCPGVIESKKIKSRFPNQVEYTGVKEEDKHYLITINGNVNKIPKEELLADVCKECEYPNPVLYDTLIGEEVETEEVFSNFIIGDMEEKPIVDRWEFWEKHFENCIRCYACREACLLCYCKTCMADLHNPQWIKRSVNLSENTAWNIMRAFHLAGRCVSCGECERVCPAEIPLMKLNKKMEKDVKEFFEHTSGLELEEKPLFGSFNPDDPEEFIM
jgi:ferredoxin